VTRLCRVEAAAAAEATAAATFAGGGVGQDLPAARYAADRASRSIDALIGLGFAASRARPSDCIAGGGGHGSTATPLLTRHHRIFRDETVTVGFFRQEKHGIILRFVTARLTCAAILCRKAEAHAVFLRTYSQSGQTSAVLTTTKEATMARATAFRHRSAAFEPPSGRLLIGEHRLPGDADACTSSTFRRTGFMVQAATSRCSAASASPSASAHRPDRGLSSVDRDGSRRHSSLSASCDDF